MPRMKDLDIDFISLVNKGANKQTVKIYKSDKEPVNSNEEEFRGFFNVIKSFFTTKEKQQIQEIKKSKEDEAMKPDDIKKMIDEALNPIMDEIKVLKGEEQPPVCDEGEKEGEESKKEPTQEEIIAKAIKEATEPLRNEIADLKKSRRAPQSLDNTNTKEGAEVKKSYIGAFEGMFNN